MASAAKVFELDYDVGDTVVGPAPDMPELRAESARPKRSETVPFEAARLSLDPLLGRTLGGKYLLEAKIGEGSMGTVYRARQLALEKTVAVKVLRTDLANEIGVARFRREALAASRLDHPNSVLIYDFGEERDGTLYLVMEHVAGRDLAQLVAEEGPLSKERIVLILVQVLAALAVAHEGGVIHRDLKPENILVVPGTNDEGEPIDLVKVCDFGIATLRDGAADPGLTIHGVVVGTPDYMSPEQARGEELDARSDLYSVGVILYQLLTGRTPFDGDNPIVIALKQIADPVVPPSRVAKNVDAAFERICMRSLEKSPEKRFASARAMRLELRVLLAKPRQVESLPSFDQPAKLPPMPVPPMPPAMLLVRRVLAPRSPQRRTVRAVGHPRLGFFAAIAFSVLVALGVGATLGRHRIHLTQVIDTLRH